jgi:hypothetical protein
MVCQNFLYFFFEKENNFILKLYFFFFLYLIGQPSFPGMVRPIELAPIHLSLEEVAVRVLQPQN